MTGGLPMWASLSILLICCACQASGAAAVGPPVPDSWLGNYSGYCLTKVVFQDGVPSCSQAESRITFSLSLTWNTTTKKLEYLQNVTGVTKGPGSSVQFKPASAEKLSLTAVSQKIAFNNKDAKPVCFSIDGNPVTFAMVVVPNDGSGKQEYLEEGVFKVDPKTFTSSWSCPSNWNWLQTSLVCNDWTYNYECTASKDVTPPPVASPAPSLSPHPTLSPSPLPLATLISSLSPSPSVPSGSPLSPSQAGSLPPSPSPLTSPSPLQPSPPLTQPLSTAVSATQQVDSPSSKTKKRTAILAGTICGAVGLIVLVAFVAVYWQRSQKQGKAWLFSSLPSATNIGDASLKDFTSITMMSSGQLLPPTIPGLMPGDPFLRTTAPQYKWNKSSPANSLAVEAGITDMRLDTMAVDGVSPAIELSSTEVQQQLELLTDGLLGRGGAALVFKCHWRQRFGEGVLAIKLLKDAFNTSVGVLQSFTYEAQLLSSIRHPQIVRLYGYCLEPPHVCLIMELLPNSLDRMLYPDASDELSTTQLPLSSTTFGLRTDSKTQQASPSTLASSKGGSFSTNHDPATGPADETVQSVSDIKQPELQQQPASSQQWTMQQVLKVSIDVAAALTHLHDRQTPVLPGVGLEGITETVSNTVGDLESQHSAGARANKVVHRDLKPANVLINSHGQAKLSDFGLAREHMSTTVHTMRVNVGTLHYMAPELLATNATKPTNRVDIYSLGIMMWELVAKQKPWHDMYKEQMITAVLSGRRPPLPRSKESDTQSAGSTETTDWNKMAAEFTACPEYSDLIRECWHQRDHKRPSAAEVLRRLQAIMREGKEQTDD